MEVGARLRRVLAQVPLGATKVAYHRGCRLGSRPWTLRLLPNSTGAKSAKVPGGENRLPKLPLESQGLPEH
jgi:hypothetical protein